MSKQKMSVEMEAKLQKAREEGIPEPIIQMSIDKYDMLDGLSDDKFPKVED